MLQLIRGCTSSLLVSSAAAAARSMSVSSILSVSTESHLVLTIPQPLFSRSTTILLLIVPWIYFQHQVLCELPMFSLLHTMLCIWHLKHQSFFLFFSAKPLLLPCQEHHSPPGVFHQTTLYLMTLSVLQRWESREKKVEEETEMEMRWRVSLPGTSCMSLSTAPPPLDLHNLQLNY